MSVFESDNSKMPLGMLDYQTQRRECYYDDGGNAGAPESTY